MNLPIYLFIYFLLFISTYYLFIYLFIDAFIYLSIYLFIIKNNSDKFYVILCPPSDLNAPCILYAGTGACVHIPLRLYPVASLAWLGKQLPCPLQWRKFYIYADGSHARTHAHTHPPTHPHTPCRSRVGEMEIKMRWQWNGMTPYLPGTRGGERKRRKELKDPITP